MTDQDLNGKVAFITGVARGQGRSHAIRLAERGVSIIGVDICADIASMDYPMASKADLDETVKLVEDTGGQILARVADVRDPNALTAVVEEGVSKFGRLDIVLANAGIIRFGADEAPFQAWNDIIDVNLTGVWNTCRVTTPALIDGGRGGSIVITSSSAGIKPTGTPKAGGQAYATAKRGLIGLCRVLALDLAKHSIRVNTIHPTGVVSGMTQNEAMAKLVEEGAADLSSMVNALPVPILPPEAITDAVEYLVSDRGQYITGVALPVDAGFSIT